MGEIEITEWSDIAREGCAILNWWRSRRLATWQLCVLSPNCIVANCMFSLLATLLK
ncbi:hypothetical protein SK128_027879, partial [Halocaridina rubra]